MLAAVPLVSFGLASFVPGLWAAGRRRGEARFRNRMLAFAVGIGAISYVALGLVVSVPNESSMAWLSSFGVICWVGSIIVATVVAVIHRKS